MNQTCWLDERVFCFFIVLVLEGMERRGDKDCER